jgi:hypothetical protein
MYDTTPKGQKQFRRVELLLLGLYPLILLMFLVQNL